MTLISIDVDDAELKVLKAAAIVRNLGVEEVAGTMMTDALYRQIPVYNGKPTNAVYLRAWYLVDAPDTQDPADE